MEQHLLLRHKTTSCLDKSCPYINRALVGAGLEMIPVIDIGNLDFIPFASCYNFCSIPTRKNPLSTEPS